MKLLLVLSLVCISAYATVNAAAIESVVEKEKDAHQDGAITASSEDVNQDCRQPREVGRCFALFYRYAFNAESLKCEKFIYGGCGGNQNNFETLEDCERKCVKKEEDHTKLPELDETSKKQPEGDSVVEKEKPEDVTEPTKKCLEN